MDTELIDRVAVLVTKRDAEQLREMAHDLEELTAGVHLLAEKALLALADGAGGRASPSCRG